MMRQKNNEQKRLQLRTDDVGEMASRSDRRPPHSLQSLVFTNLVEESSCLAHVALGPLGHELGAGGSIGLSKSVVLRVLVACGADQPDSRSARKSARAPDNSSIAHVLSPACTKHCATWLPLRCVDDGRGCERAGPVLRRWAVASLSH